MLRPEMLHSGCVIEETFAEHIKFWAYEEAPWWMCSFVFHLVLVCSLALMGTEAIKQIDQDIREIEYVQPDVPPPPIVLVPVDHGEEILPPPPESNATPPGDQPDTIEGIERSITASDAASQDHILATGVDHSATPNTMSSFLPGGPLIPTRFDTGSKGRDGLGGPGDGGSGSTDSYGPRGHAPGSPVVFGPTKAGDAAVRLALNWLMRHQQNDGRWSLAGFRNCCSDASCTMPGNVEADTAGTAMALLPFLAAGYTHTSLASFQEPRNAKQRTARDYRRTVNNGLYWLLKHQTPDGDLRAGSTMYAHGLATIALCEAYGMTKDPAVGAAAQRAIVFIERAQNKQTGGWRYQPGPVDPGDTSVVGWQVMALKSGQMARLRVDTAVLDRAKAFLRTVASDGGAFAYTPGGGPSPTMTSVGLLCSQYLGAHRTDPTIVEGTASLMKSLPGEGPSDVYYLYYATQVMHNQPGPDWDVWNRKMRRTLVAAQCQEKCAAGSWNPETDRWGTQGGRLMMTSLAALSLEVYYRYMPLYTFDREE